MIMTACPYCQLPRIEPTTVSCTFGEIKVNGDWYKRNFISFGGETIKIRCKQCGITIGPGHYHHYGCENEACPVCLRKIITCVCEKSHLRNGQGDIVEIGK